MLIDGKNWKTVTNYIYANMLTNRLYINEVMSKKASDVYKTFLDLKQKENNDVIRKALEQAMSIKFENKELAELLLTTGNSPIIYVSSNTLLGTGPANEGENLYGKYLVQTRYSIRNSLKKQHIEKEKSRQEQLIYDTYLADQALTKAIKGGSDLKQFISKTPIQIIDIVGRIDLEKAAPNRSVIIQMYEKKQLSDYLLTAIDFPNTLVLSVRKREMRKLRLRKIKEQKEIIFGMYADYMLSKHYPDIKSSEYEKAKIQSFSKLSWEERNNLEDRLYTLFEKGMLSSRLSDSIDVRMASFHIPSEQEVQEAENVSVELGTKQVITEVPYAPETGEPIYVFSADFPQIKEQYIKFTVFSPVDTRYGMIRIDGKLFPSISHYITCKLIAHVKSVGSMSKAYPMILKNPSIAVEDVESFIDIVPLSIKYIKLSETNYAEELENLMIKGLDKKFEDRVLQDILVMTGKATLLYTDFSNPILGVGDKDQKGQNLVGKYLMKLRAKYTELHKQETVHNLTVADISMIFNRDPFMKQWLVMRVRDMCKVVMVMKNYLLIKSGVGNKRSEALTDENNYDENGNYIGPKFTFDDDVKIDKKFVSVVLDKVYQPCSTIFGSAELVKAEVPDYFEMIVRRCKGFESVDKDVIVLMWRRLAVIVYYLIKYMKNSSIQNLRAVIGLIEQLVTKGGKCPDVLEDPYDNCILSAILNVTTGIVEFNNQFSYSSEVTDYDIKVAASIIVNSDLTTKIEPKLVLTKEKEEEEDESDEEEEVEEEEQFFFPEEEKEEELEFEDYDVSSRRSEDEGFSPNTKMIISILKEIDQVKDLEGISDIIESAIQAIKVQKMSKQVKRNRINFFATQRS
jgi:predicted NAD-dependent protein-ADP-ribosyltransferase YbiA (DUF1768 family)